MDGDVELTAEAGNGLYRVQLSVGILTSKTGVHMEGDVELAAEAGNGLNRVRGEN
jgi:hypothetical protein